MWPVVIVVILPLSQLVVEEVNVVGDPVTVEQLVELLISGVGVFYPDEGPTQRVGIIPDIEARPTIRGIRSGRDEVLEVALRHILGPGVPAAVIERMAKQ